MATIRRVSWQFAAAVAATALLAAACGDDGTNTEVGARPSGASSAIDALPELDLLDDYDRDAHELVCPPGDFVSLISDTYDDVTLEGLSESGEELVERTPVEEVAARLEYGASRHEDAETRSVRTERVAITVGLLQEIDTPEPAVRSEQEERELQALEEGDTALQPSPSDDEVFNGPEPSYPTLAPRSPEADEDPPDNSSPDRPFTVVIPLDPTNPDGPYIFKATGWVVAGRYSLIFAVSQCDIVIAPFEGRPSFDNVEEDDR